MICSTNYAWQINQSRNYLKRRLGISLNTLSNLQDLLEQAPCNQIAVQERLQIDPAALTRHFKILKGKDLSIGVETKKPAEILIHLTDTAYNRLVKHPLAIMWWR